MLIHLTGALPGLVKHAVAELQQIFRNTGRGVGQEGQHVRLRIPKVMAFIGLARHPLGRNAGAFRPPRRLAELEQVPTQHLLCRLGGSLGLRGVDLDPHIAAVPEIVQPLPLARQQRREPLPQGAIEGALGAPTQLLGGHRARGMVGEVFGQAYGLPGLGVDGKHHVAGILRTGNGFGVGTCRLEHMVDPTRQRHLAMLGVMAQHEAAFTRPMPLGEQHPTAEAVGPPRVVLLSPEVGLIPVHLRRQDDGGLGIEHGDLIGESGQMAVLKGDETLGVNAHLLAGRCLPQHLTVQGTSLHIEHALEPQQRGGGEKKRLIVYVQLDHLAIGDVHHRLARLGKAVRVLAIDNGPDFVKAIDKGAVMNDRSAFLTGAAQAQVAVAEGKDRFGLGQKTRREPIFDELPRMAWVDVLGWWFGLISDHRGITLQITTVFLTGGVPLSCPILFSYLLPYPRLSAMTR